MVSAALRPQALKCEYRPDPVGIDALHPRLSWELASKENGENQTRYRILVASSTKLLDAHVGDVWDTKIVHSSQSVNVPYGGAPLRSGQKCFWKVMAWDKDGVASAWSSPSFWSMGLLTRDDWKTQWIGLDKPVGMDDTTEYTRLSARYVRKEFQVGQRIQSATAYICGLGLYELSINGKKVGNEVLVPAQTQFNKTVLYNTYDVTGSITKGANAIGVVLGNGRYFTMRKSKNANFGFPKMVLQVEIVFDDGTRQIIASDGTWKITGDGPITENNEYDGEKYDARKEMKGWDKVGFDDAAWISAEVLRAPSDRLVAQMNEPIRITETITPISVKKIRHGLYIFDMGQNMVGWVRLRARADAGTRIRLRFAESLDGDSLYLANIRDAKVTDEYICRGGALEEWQPRFTYHGFRFVEMTGFPGEPDLATIEGAVVHDDVTRIGRFACSNDVMNRTFRNAIWGIRGNYRSFPTDCPQRDERQGWLGDRAAGSKGESYVFNIASLYAKWVRDIIDAQRADGSIPDVCPAYWDLYSDNVTWDGTPIVLLAMLREQYADMDIIRQAYPSMKKWHAYMSGRYLRNDLMPRDTYGDWCVPPDEPEAIHSADPSKRTSGSYIGSAYFYFLTTTMSKFAQLLGEKDDEASFARQAERMKASFNKTYFDEKTRTYSNNTATASILALAFDLVEPANRKTVADNLVEVIETRFRGHIPTGLVGAQFLMRTLTRIGRADIAHRFATQTDYPSWGYMARSGATTIWELWNGNTADPAMNSQNHVMLLGDLLSWFYEDLAGIRTREGEAGFKELVMNPTLIAGLDSVQASHVSPYGPILSAWRVADKQFSWDITVPVNVTATVHIPAGRPEDVTENGRPISQTRDHRIVGMQDGKLVIQIASGRYHFSSTGFAVVEPPLNVATPRIDAPRLSDARPIPIRITCETPGATVRFTTNDTPPNGASQIYHDPFEVGKSCVVRARAFKEGYTGSYEAKAEFDIHRERIPVQGITFLTPYSSKYLPARGDRTLIDGEEGSLSYTDKKWAGYEAGDMVVVLDMGKTTEIHSVIMRFLSNPGSWIFTPEAIEVSTSNTGEQFTPASSVQNGVPQETYPSQKYSIPLNTIEARYLKIRVKNYGTCPDWHTSAGGAAWMFVDEIFVE
ncbi:MAG: family 78 glycoside hydrolase catalytic domain [Ignavibacteriae bacterium]|nr:family 78 glycoside hydrolase catalytic domain [Ignavibacteriota bacterium]